MKRKINKVGPGTLTVSLPKSWVKINKLEKGDELEIETKGNLLVLYGKGKKEEGMIEIEVPHERRVIGRFLSHFHKLGKDTLKIKFENSKSIKFVEKEIQQFIGYEIMEKGDDFCIIKNITGPKEDEFDSILKKMFRLTLFMSDTMFNMFKSGKFKNLSDIARLEATQNKLYSFCQRCINSAGKTKFPNPTFNYLLVQRIEDIGDDLKFIAEHYMTKKEFRPSKETLIFFEDVNNYIKEIYDLYYNYDTNKLPSTSQNHLKLSETGNKLYKVAPREEILLIGKLIDIVRGIFNAASPVNAINFEESRKGTKTQDH